MSGYISNMWVSNRGGNCREYNVIAVFQLDVILLWYCVRNCCTAQISPLKSSSSNRQRVLSAVMSHRLYNQSASSVDNLPQPDHGASRWEWTGNATFVCAIRPFWFKQAIKLHFVKIKTYNLHISKLHSKFFIGYSLVFSNLISVYSRTD